MAVRTSRPGDRLDLPVKGARTGQATCRGGFSRFALAAQILDRSWVLIRSGCFGAGFDKGEPLIAKVGDYLQAAAEGFDVGGQGAQFGGAWLGVLDSGNAALGDAHSGSDLGLGDAEAAAHLGEPEGALLGAQLLDPSGDGGLVGRIGIELGEELIPGVMVELAAAHRMSSCFR